MRTPLPLVTEESKEFKKHGIQDFVTAQQKDVCGKDGFGDDLKNKVDAVFLDLPHPWDAIPHARSVLKKSTLGRLCSFSPCVEQVQKAIEKMREVGFCEISTIECLLREFQVRKITTPTFDPTREDPSLIQIPSAKSNSTANKDEASFVTGIPLLSMPGHTGYLTFASLPPINVNLA